MGFGNLTNQIMWHRTVFFWLEALQITPAERRVLLTLILLNLLFMGFTLFVPGRTIFDDAYYEPIVAEFERLSGVRAKEQSVLLAAYHPEEREGRRFRKLFPSSNVPGVPIFALDMEERAGKADDGEEATPQKEEGLVPIQYAGADELTALPGIGPVMAGRIIEYRKKNGPFQNADDLLNVTGIGPATLKRLLPLITLDDNR